MRRLGGWLCAILLLLCWALGYGVLGSWALGGIGGQVAWADASLLQNRLETFPHWQKPPSLPPAQGDLIYPDWFAGDWQVTSTLLEQVAPLSPAITSPGFESNRRWLNQPVQFPVKFGRNPQGQVIADRVFNGASLARAYLGDAVQQVKLDPQSVNRQVVLFRSACPESGYQANFQKYCDRQLVTITQTRQQDPPTPLMEDWLTSELSQQQFKAPSSQVYFNQVENTTAYHHNGQNSGRDNRQLNRSGGQIPTITADQLTAIYLSPQDPDYFRAQNRPVALYRYRLAFDRTSP
jgi:hypothetical protein